MPPAWPGGTWSPVSEREGYVLVPLAMVEEFREHIAQRAVQNHKLHQDWNEGMGEFSTCTRGDCTEVRVLLKRWEHAC